MLSFLLVQLPNLTGFLSMVWLRYKHRGGWLWGLASEVLWLVWSLYAHAYGIIPWCFVWAAVYVANYLKWKGDDENRS